MATNFPASLDTLTNPTSSDSLSSPSHSAQHANVNDAVEALQAKVGVDSSAVTSSHDYLIADHASRLTTLEGASGGKILQVVHAQTDTTTTTNSTSFVDTSLSATITPSSTSSKIFIAVSVRNLRNPNSNTAAYLTVFRGNASTGTDLATDTFGFAQTYGGYNTNHQNNAAFVTLDSPATTSATTYTAACRVAAGYNMDVKGTQSMVLMEVAV